MMFTIVGTDYNTASLEDTSADGTVKGKYI
jgi:hypothetical protein